jgi:hypothetical protein
MLGVTHMGQVALFLVGHVTTPLGSKVGISRVVDIHLGRGPKGAVRPRNETSPCKQVGKQRGKHSTLSGKELASPQAYGAREVYVHASFGHFLAFAAYGARIEQRPSGPIVAASSLRCGC